MIEGLRELARLEVPLDLVIWPRHLPAVLALLERVPGLVRDPQDHVAAEDLAPDLLAGRQPRMSLV